MSRQSRILLVMVLFAIGGVSALALMANRYSKILAGDRSDRAAASPRLRESGRPAPASLEAWRRQAEARALEQVDDFVRVRQRIRQALANDPDPGSGDPVVAAREQALADVGMHPELYGRIRTLYRSWKTGRLDRTTAVSAAFELRRDELLRLDLGDYERSDV